MAIDTSYDNRETCGNQLVPTSCLPYTGYVSDTIKDLLHCRQNANDVFKNLQILIDDIKKGLGDNTKLDATCFDFNPSEDSQQQLNQELLSKVCDLSDKVEQLINDQINPDLIKLAVNLLCLDDAGCEPKTEYTLTELITKLIAKYCDLATRVTNLEQ
jgi:hypothetical protein